jgi:ferrous iron transport protein B
VRPLGWDWRIGCAVIASFPAREVVMGALGVIYNLGADLDVGEQSDQDRLSARMMARTIAKSLVQGSHEFQGA